MSEEEIENYKIGMYKLGEIYNEMTNNMLQRSMTDAIRDKFYDLENQLQQKENIIKEVREELKEDNKYLESAKEMYINQNNEILKTHTLQLINNSLVQNDKLLEILDKGE